MIDYKITKREVLFSSIIVMVLVVIGIFISNNINNALLDDFQEYDTALQINNDKELFEYGMRTSVGNAFVYGELKAVDTVSYPEVDGEYSYIEKVTERYTKHWKQVTKTRTNSKGETETYTVWEEYYTWDYEDKESKHSKKITFMDVEFDYGKINLPYKSKIDTIYERSRWSEQEGDIRYVYSGSPTKCEGTLYAKLLDKDIKDVKFSYNKNIDETLQSYKSYFWLILFWIGWVILIIVSVFGFWMIDNKWLEDR